MFLEEEEQAIVERIFSCAAMKIGSAAQLAETLGLSYDDLQDYLDGGAVPPDPILFCAVALILDELPAIRASSSDTAWRALSLP